MVVGREVIERLDEQGDELVEGVERDAAGEQHPDPRVTARESEDRVDPVRRDGRCEEAVQRRVLAEVRHSGQQVTRIDGGELVERNDVEEAVERLARHVDLVEELWRCRN